LTPKAIQRWKRPKDLQDDGRKTRLFKPSNKITQEEHQHIICTANSAEFASMTPHQIEPILAKRNQDTRGVWDLGVKCASYLFHGKAK